MADLDAPQLVTLKNEFTTNPKGLAYAGKTDLATADLLNTAGASNEKQIGNGLMSSAVLMGGIVLSEWTALSAALQNRLSFWLSPGTVDTSNVNVRQALASVFGGATVTQANLLAAVDKPISRGEALFGVGTVINYWDVARAKAL